MLAEHRLNRQFCSQSFSRAHFSEDRRLLQPLSEQGSANTKNSTEQKCDAGTTPIMDGAKRDRYVWSVDLAVSAPTIYYTSGVVSGSLRLRSSGQVPG